MSSRSWAPLSVSGTGLPYWSSADNLGRGRSTHTTIPRLDHQDLLKESFHVGLSRLRQLGPLLRQLLVVNTTPTRPPHVSRPASSGLVIRQGPLRRLLFPRIVAQRPHRPMAHARGVQAGESFLLVHFVEAFAGQARERRRLRVRCAGVGRRLERQRPTCGCGQLLMRKQASFEALDSRTRRRGRGRRDRVLAVKAERVDLTSAFAIAAHSPVRVPWVPASSSPGALLRPNSPPRQTHRSGWSCTPW